MDDRKKRYFYIEYIYYTKFILFNLSDVASLYTYNEHRVNALIKEPYLAHVKSTTCLSRNNLTSSTNDNHENGDISFSFFGDNEVGVATRDRRLVGVVRGDLVLLSDSYYDKLCSC